MQTDWVMYRRESDGERLGWIAPKGDDYVAINLLGAEVSEAVDWLEAEAALEQIGIAYLAEPYELLTDEGQWIPVRITNISTSRINVKTEDGGAIDAPSTSYTVDFPIPNSLRQRIHS